MNTVAGVESGGNLGLLQQAPEGPADCVPAGQHPAVATAARVPASFCQAAAGGCSPLCYAHAHLRCDAVKQPVVGVRGGGGRAGGGVCCALTRGLQAASGDADGV